MLKETFIIFYIYYISWMQKHSNLDLFCSFFLYYQITNNDSKDSTPFKDLFHVLPSMHKVTYLHMQVVMIGVRGAAFMPQEHQMKFMFITHPIRKSSLKISDNLSYRITYLSGEMCFLINLMLSMHIMFKNQDDLHDVIGACQAQVSSYVKKVLLDRKTWTLKFAFFPQRIIHRSKT